DGGVLEHLRLLHRDQDQVEDTVVLADALIVEEHLVDGEGHVMLGLELDDVADFLRRHLRNLYFLDDQFPAADRNGAARALEPGPGDGASDGLDDRRGVLMVPSVMASGGRGATPR